MPKIPSESKLDPIKIDIHNSVMLERTPRLIQLEGMFDLVASEVSEFRLKAELPLHERKWNVGLITGPSGTGKSTLAKKLAEHFNTQVVTMFQWPERRSIIEGFSLSKSIKGAVHLLSSVGFSSPPAWLKPFHVLSTGEQFRVTLARALHEGVEGIPTIMDEFTSVVDRTVARIGSAAISKTIRRENLSFVAVTCHDDVEEWLQPDWKFDTFTGQFTWRLLQRRPEILFTIRRGSKKDWELFRRHHYLSESLSVGSKCFVGEINNNPVAFTAVVAFPHPRRPGWREHRTVCLPDYQGVGLGNAMSNYIASLFSRPMKPYRSVTSHPAMILYRSKSPLWKMVRKPDIAYGLNKEVGMRSYAKLNETSAWDRVTATFEYVGIRRPEEAKKFGLEFQGAKFSDDLSTR